VTQRDIGIRINLFSVKLRVFLVALCNSYYTKLRKESQFAQRDNGFRINKTILCTSK